MKSAYSLISWISYSKPYCARVENEKDEHTDEDNEHEDDADENAVDNDDEHQIIDIGNQSVQYSEDKAKVITPVRGTTPVNKKAKNP